MIHRWSTALAIIVVGMIGAYILFLNIPKSDKLLLCLCAYTATKLGIAWLTTRRGGWRVPGGFFIVWYSLSWSGYVLYIVTRTYGGHPMPVHLLDLLYASMFVSALGSVLTFPWIEPGQDGRARALDRRSDEQDRRGLRLDLRGKGQDERAKLLTRRTTDIDTRSDEISRREGVQQAYDQENQR